jgi:hypothetical protein
MVPARSRESSKSAPASGRRSPSLRVGNVARMTRRPATSAASPRGSLAVVIRRASSDMSSVLAASIEPGLTIQGAPSALAALRVHTVVPEVSVSSARPRPSAVTSRASAG